MTPTESAPAPAPATQAIARGGLWGLSAGLGALYLTQGLVAGVGTLVVAVMAAQGHDLESQTGVLAMGALPWLLKLVWALLWDRLAPPGSKRRWPLLLATQLAVAAGLSAFAGGRWFAAAPWAFFALNLAASWQDVGADAFAIDHTPPARRGRINAVMAGARALGVGWLGASVLYAAWGRWGPEATMLGLAALVAGLGLALLPLRAPNTAPRAAPVSASWAELPRALVATPHARAALGLCALALLGDALSGAVALDFLQKRAGWSLSALTEQLVPLQVGAELVAYALAAAFVDRIGGLRCVAGASLLLAIGWGSFGFAESLWTEPDAVRALAVLESAARAWLFVGLYAFAMRATSPQLRATHFVVLMSLLNLPRVLGPWLAPELHARSGYAGIWLMAAGCQLVVLVYAAWLVRRIPPDTPAEGPRNVGRRGAVGRA